MNSFHETVQFSGWLEKLADSKGKIRILARLRSAMGGNFGDCKAVGDGVSEMRVHYGPGYRIYYAQEGRRVYLLLLGGDKGTQKRDIQRAKKLWRNIQEGEHGNQYS